MKFAIGIDLGTTYSCVGVCRDDKVEIIPNELGNRKIPSCVAFTDTERLIGDEAKYQMDKNPENTVYDAKRLIGRKFNDNVVQSDMKSWPFKVVEGVDEKPMIVVNFKGKEEKFSPEQISSMVLSKIKETAENFLNATVKHVVITVPAYFNDSQRQATKEAASIAGLKVIRIMNEPTAAAIAYGLNVVSDIERNVFIFDLGGRTFDITLITVESGIFEVRAVSGDAHLGGEDFDNRLLEYCVAHFLNTTDIDIRNDSRVLRRLKTQCERAKRVLSSSNQATIEVDSLKHGKDFALTITRSKFEELNMDYFQKCLLLVEQMLKDSGVTKSQIHDVIVVGGSSRIPKVQKLLKEFFNEHELKQSINPEEAVAYGASLQAATLNKDKEINLQDLLLVPVIPLSMGIETAGGLMTKIIEKNTWYPFKRTQTFTTHFDNQPGVQIKVYVGERALAKDNHLFATLDLEDIPSAPRGVPRIEVTLDMDANGVVNVSAKNTITGQQKTTTLCPDNIIFTDEKINQLVKEAKDFKKQDALVKKRVEVKNHLNQLTYIIKRITNDENSKAKFTESESSQILKAINEIEIWIDSNPNATIEEFDAKMKETESISNPIMAEINDQGGPEVESLPQLAYAMSNLGESPEIGGMD